MEHENFFYIYDVNTSERSIIIINTRFFKKQKNYTTLTVYILDILSKGILISQKNNYNQYDVLVYMDETKITDIDLSFFKDLVKILLEAFPNALNKCYIINFPSFLRSIYNTLSTFLDKDL